MTWDSREAFDALVKEFQLNYPQPSRELLYTMAEMTLRKSRPFSMEYMLAEGVMALNREINKLEQALRGEWCNGTEGGE